jgi:hypothetical protein
MKTSQKLSRGKAKTKILELASRKGRPLCVGEVSLDLGLCWSLAETEDLLEEMAVEGTLEFATEEGRPGYRRCK